MTRPQDQRGSSSKSDYQPADAASGDELDHKDAAAGEHGHAPRTPRKTPSEAEQVLEPKTQPELRGDEDPLQDPSKPSSATQLLQTYQQQLSSADLDEESLLAQLCTYSQPFRDHALHRYVIALLAPREGLLHKEDELHCALWHARCSVIYALVDRVEGKPDRAVTGGLQSRNVAVIRGFCRELAAHFPEHAATVNRVLQLWEAPSAGGEIAAALRDDAMARLLLAALVRKSLDGWFRRASTGSAETESREALYVVWDKISKAAACFSGASMGVPYTLRALHDAGAVLLRHAQLHAASKAAQKRRKSSSEPEYVGKIAALLFEKAGQLHFAFEAWALSVNAPLSNTVRDRVHRAWQERKNLRDTTAKSSRSAAYAALAAAAAPQPTAARLALSRVQDHAEHNEACCCVVVARLRDLLSQKGPLRRGNDNNPYMPQMHPNAIEYWVVQLVEPLPQNLVNDLRKIRRRDILDGRYDYCTDHKLTATVMAAALELLCTAEDCLGCVERGLASLVEASEFEEVMSLAFAGGFLVNWVFKVVEQLHYAGLATASECFRIANRGLNFTTAELMTTGSLNKLEGIMDAEGGLWFARTLIKVFSGHIVVQVGQKLPRKPRSALSTDAKSALEGLVEVRELMTRMQRVVQLQEDEHLAAWFDKLHGSCCLLRERHLQE